uniref:Endoplasmic reticulum metallopeptidase 1 n=2 Tax=Cyprinus carpio TaxID=7962 RepID=A0A9J8B3I4_CYPCA
MSDPEMIEFSERDSTVRRTRAEQNQQQQQRDSDEEEAALNAPQSREHKPLMGESLAVILLLGFGFLLWIVVLISFQQLIISSSSPKHFSSVRARKHLEQITSIGPRTVGSPENENTTVSYLLDQIEQIRSESETGPHSITVDIQRPSGCFSIGCYDRITNIAVKLQPKTSAQHFMLANCHFDSVANSPGASDDAVGCSVMLEVLHSLANLSTPLKHGVIFLFNGAEETILQASHGFITQHPWARQVRAFVNLEAAGVGGKELVFQTGDNILSVLKHLVMSDELADSSQYRHGNMVFFDLLGLTMLVYPAHVGTVINYIVAVAAVIYLSGKCLLTSCAGCVSGRHVICAAGRYMRDLVCVVCVLVLSWIFSLVTLLFVAWLVTLMGRSMFWYSHIHAAVFLYGSAAVCILLLIHTLVKNRCYRCVCVVQRAGRVDLAELFFDGSLLLWCFVLFFFTHRGWCSAYVPMMMVLFPLISKLLLTKLFRARGASLQYSVLYLMGLVVPYVYIMFLIRVIFEVFTPILGRSKDEIPPDIIMASLVTVATVILSSYIIHFIYLSRGTKRVLAVLGSVFMLMFVLVSCGLFFPYSADPSSPRPKRVFVQHITRSFHTLNGSLQSSDSGLCINDLDYTGMQHITPHIPQINDSISTHCQDWLPYYGYTRKSWYLPAPEVSPKAPLEVQLLSRQETQWGTVKMSFEVKGPSHMSLYLHPHAGASLSSWSFNDWNFVFYTHGLDAPVWRFWIEILPLKSSNVSPDEGLVSLAITAHYLSGSDGRSETLESFLKRFPAWVFSSSWISTYHMYTY